MNHFHLLRCPKRFCVVFVVSFFASFLHASEPLKVMAWNVEHLNESNGVGCVPRTDSDYAVISQQIKKIEPDVVAFQEVENAAAAKRIFDPSEWQIVFSKRANTGPGSECRGLEGQHLRHLGTGFALLKGLEFERNPDFDELGLTDDFLRWGTDITLKREGKEVLRLLSIHLKSGCWGPPQDQQRSSACPPLRAQSTLLAAWVQDRTRENTPYVILGDFNRRLGLAGDWMWSELNADREHPLHLLDQNIKAKCDPRYIDFIDHFVLDDRAFKLYQAGSFKEIPRVGDHPDHCAITAEFHL